MNGIFISLDRVLQVLGLEILKKLDLWIPAWSQGIQHGC